MDQPLARITSNWFNTRPAVGLKLASTSRQPTEQWSLMSRFRAGVNRVSAVITLVIQLDRFNKSATPHRDWHVDYMTSVAIVAEILVLLHT